MKGYRVAIMEIKTVGFVGVGTMGRGMVSNLAKNNFRVIAYNRTKEKIKDIIRKFLEKNAVNKK